MSTILWSQKLKEDFYFVLSNDKHTYRVLNFHILKMLFKLEGNARRVCLTQVLTAVQDRTKIYRTEYISALRLIFQVSLTVDLILS